MCLPALKAGFNFIRLATPTTDDKRLPAVLTNTSGFVYYVSITGITGSAAPDAGKVADAVERIKRHTTLPVCVGFGVRTAEQARAHRARRRWRRGRLGAGRRGAQKSRRRRQGDAGNRAGRGRSGSRAGAGRARHAARYGGKRRLRRASRWIYAPRPPPLAGAIFAKL